MWPGGGYRAERRADRPGVRGRGHHPTGRDRYALLSRCLPRAHATPAGDTRGLRPEVAARIPERTTTARVARAVRRTEERGPAANTVRLSPIAVTRALAKTATAVVAISITRSQLRTADLSHLTHGTPPTSTFRLYLKCLHRFPSNLC